MLRRSLVLFTLLMTCEPADVFAQGHRAAGDPGPGSALCGLCFLGVYYLVWFGVAVWVYDDSSRYRMNSFLWAFLVFITGFVGLIVYIIVRSNTTNPKSRSRPRRRRYDEVNDADARPRRRRTEETDEERESRQRRERWERDADY